MLNLVLNNNMTSLNIYNYSDLGIFNYFVLEKINKDKRKIFVTDKGVWKINSGGIEKNVNTGMEDNFQYNNIKNKKIKKYNTNNNVPWWLDKEIKENPASPEEQAEMEALLGEFKKD